MSGQVRVKPYNAQHSDGATSAADMAALRSDVVTVQLSHPGKLNAMSRAMWVQLRSVFESLQANTHVRCIVVEGEGDAFCAGGDISEYTDFRFDPESLAAFHESEVWPALHAMLQCDVPVVALVRGACMGAGVEIASACDIRIAASNAQFGAPIAKLGFPMAPREAALVAAAVGPMKARQMLLEAAVFSADAMQASGFVSRVLALDQLLANADTTVQRIARLAPQAARLNKQTLRALAQADWQADALQNPYAYARSAEHREGIAAFMEKRPPQF